MRFQRHFALHPRTVQQIQFKRAFYQCIRSGLSGERTVQADAHSGRHSGGAHFDACSGDD